MRHRPSQRSSQRPTLRLLMFAAAVPLATAACGERAAATKIETPASRSAPATSALTRVAAVEHVCMVNNQFMGVQQIPVEVAGKTYFGCCEMCKGRLVSDASVRFAIDPHTGERVDKATAVIAVQPNKAVQYFASEQSFADYSRKTPR